MKNTLLSFFIASMLSLHGVEIIQKKDSNQADISIAIKEVFADTENNCYYYELGGTNHTDIQAYCDAKKLDTKIPNPSSLDLLHQKYSKIIQKYKDQYYAWYYQVNAALLTTAAISGYLALHTPEEKYIETIALVSTFFALVYNLITIANDESKNIDLSEKITPGMNIPKKTTTLRSYDELKPVYTYSRKHKHHNWNSEFSYTRTTTTYLDIIHGYNKILICTSTPLQEVYYKILPEINPDFKYKVELLLN